MKILFCLFLFLIFTFSYSAEIADSSKSRLQADGTFSLNSNGIASIPAFSLEKPAAIASVTLTKNRFIYEPHLAYGFDLRPWFIDNWLLYKFIDRPVYEIRTGVNISSIFNDYKVMDETVFKGERYFAIELRVKYKISPNSSLSLVYWNDNGLDEGTLQGHFFNLIGEKSEIKIGKNVSLSTTTQLYYFNYNSNNDGLFITPHVSASARNVPFDIFIQVTQPINTNISPSPGFKWNLGLSYTL